MGPLACSAQVQDEVLVVHCRRLDDTGELAAHAQQGKVLTARWQAEFRDSEGREPSLELRADKLSLSTSVRAWHDFLAGYDIAFTAGVPIPSP